MLVRVPTGNMTHKLGYFEEGLGTNRLFAKMWAGDGETSPIITETGLAAAELSPSLGQRVGGATVLWKDRTFSLDRKSNLLSGTSQPDITYRE